MPNNSQPNEELELNHVLYVVGLVDNTDSQTNNKNNSVQNTPKELECGIEGRSVLESIFEFE